MMRDSLAAGVTMQNPDRHEHIAELNRLGRQVQNLHESYQRD